MQDGRFVLTDFGSARRVPEPGLVRESPATIAFYPPEVCDLEPGGSYDGYKSDLWAAGVTLWVVRYGVMHISVRNASITNLLDDIRNFDVRSYTSIDSDPESNIPPIFHNLLSEDPSVRTYTLGDHN